MMPIFALPGVISPGQLGPMSRLVAPGEVGLDAHHVGDGHALGDADDERHARIGRFHDGVGGGGRRARR